MQALRDIIRDPAFPQGSRWKYRSFKPGEVIVQQGRPGLSMYMIEKGMLEVSAKVELADGLEARPGLCQLGPGDVFGEFSLFEERPRAATVKAVTDGLLVEFDIEALRKYMDEHPAAGYELLRALFRTMVERLNSTNERIAYAVAWGLGTAPRKAGA